jgi:hypothetical protein
VKKILRTLIGHGHNFATRGWIITVVGVYWFHRFAVRNAESQPAMASLNKEFFYLGLVCIAIIFLAGWGRTFYPNDVKKIFDKTREKERIKQLSKMYVILFAVLFPLLYFRYSSVTGFGKELLFLAVLCLAVMLPMETERSLRFRYIGNAYGSDPANLEQVWKKMMIWWHVVLLSALAAGTYFQYGIVNR